MLGAELRDGLIVGVIDGCDVGGKDGFAVGWLESVGKLLGEEDGNMDGSPVMLGCNVCDGDMTTNVTRMKGNAGQEYSS